ncbi:hypothetical protein NFX39_05665 [Fructobacillus sp. W13]|uniref:Uncharacterized protein n=1 Tax=Fructobacillus apis TaxID=2935017 RepID=A0ABT0ZRG2_9LACO|nr:hypothetical protein [Fructobacillus apis]MCO0832565.1 hypothetical protein [Fructobacillus apis]
MTAMNEQELNALIKRKLDEQAHRLSDPSFDFENPNNNPKITIEVILKQQ